MGVSKLEIILVGSYSSPKLPWWEIPELGVTLVGSYPELEVISSQEFL